MTTSIKDGGEFNSLAHWKGDLGDKFTEMMISCSNEADYDADSLSHCGIEGHTCSGEVRTALRASGLLHEGDDKEKIKDLTVCDIGCGIGNMLKVLQDKLGFVKLYGAELNKKSVEICNKKNPSFVVKSIESNDWDFCSEGVKSFDLVYVSAVLNHIPPESRKDFFKVITDRLQARYFMFWEVMVPKDVDKYITEDMHGWVFHRDNYERVCDEELNHSSLKESGYMYKKVYSKEMAFPHQGGEEKPMYDRDVLAVYKRVPVEA
eukprot:Nk52_evm1s1270 gene=Nk52_evmTU1s1270